MKVKSLSERVDEIVNGEILIVLNELTAILDLSDEFSYRELYEQARTYIFNKRMEIENETKPI